MQAFELNVRITCIGNQSCPLFVNHEISR